MTTQSHDPVSAPIHEGMPGFQPVGMVHPRLPVIAYLMAMLLVVGCGAVWALKRFDTVVVTHSVADDSRATTAVSTHRLLQDDAQVARDALGPSMAVNPLLPPGTSFPSLPSLSSLPSATSASNAGVPNRPPVPLDVLASSSGQAPLPPWPALPSVAGPVNPALLQAPQPIAPARSGGALASRQEPLMVSGAGTTNAGLPGSVDGGAVGRDHAIGSLLMSDQRQSVRATRLADRDFLLAEGAHIDCVLQTRLDSTLPGLTSCIVTDSVFSDTGKHILVERGSLATGEYRSEVAQGQKRIFVVWQRIKTPHGVVVNLDSPATDALGATGIPMDVDAHWVSRIGAAFLLSIVEDAVVAATAPRASSNASATTTFTNTSQTTQSLSEKVLESSINQPPTLTRDEGQRISIMVARDLYFNTVYAQTH